MSRESRIINCIRSYTMANRVPPTYTDLVLGTGIPRMTIFRLAARLVDEGELDKGVRGALLIPGSSWNMPEGEICATGN
jgi:hypothetical protein